MLIEKRQEKLNKIRKEGYVAGVLFGREIGSVSIKTKPEEFNSAFNQYGMVKTFKVKLDGKTHEVYFKDIEKDILKPRTIVHFSLLKVSKGDKVTAPMPVHILDQEEVVKQGLVINQFVHELETEYPAGEAVNYLEISVKGLNAGDALHVKELKLPEGFKVFLNPDDVIATVTHPKVNVIDEKEVEEPVEVKEESSDAE